MSAVNENNVDIKCLFREPQPMLAGVFLTRSAAKEHRTDVVAAMESLAVLRATPFPGQALPISWTRVAPDSSFLCVTSETSDSTKHFCFKDLGLGFAFIGLLQGGWVHLGTLWTDGLVSEGLLHHDDVQLQNRKSKITWNH